VGNDIAVIILGTAILVLMGWGLRGFFADPQIHLALRVVVGAVGGGILALVIKLVKARIDRARAGGDKEEKQ